MYVKASEWVRFVRCCQCCCEWQCGTGLKPTQLRGSAAAEPVGRFTNMGFPGCGQHQGNCILPQHHCFGTTAGASRARAKGVTSQFQTKAAKSWATSRWPNQPLIAWLTRQHACCCQRRHHHINGWDVPVGRVCLTGLPRPASPCMLLWRTSCMQDSLTNKVAAHMVQTSRVCP